MSRPVCTCTPCVTPAFGHPTIDHCAACCAGSLIEQYDHDCPVAEHRTLAVQQFGPRPGGTAVTQQNSSDAFDERKSQEGGSVTFNGCDVDGVPISGTFASIDQVANTFSSDAPEGLAMAHALRGVLVEVTDMQAGIPMLAGPVTLMSGTTGGFRLLDSQGVEYEVFVRKYVR